jgi:RNA polymerase sigma factor (sigma-70 family)
MDTMTQTIQTEVLHEREALVRFCARYTGDRDAAEDLAQRTLLHAWQHEHQLRDARARQSWLFGIAHTQCLMWGRTRSRERSRLVALGQDVPSEYLADDYDFEAELERDDLARLLDRALGALPADVRDVLVWRYIEESPQLEMAARLGVTEGAVEARLHRGKLALKRILHTEFGAEAAAYGLIAPSEVGWEETRIWCPNCGRRRLEGWFRPAEGKLYMRCPRCETGNAHFIHARHGDGFQNIRSYKPAVKRVLQTIHHLFRLSANGRATRCPVCGQSVPFIKGAPPWLPADLQNPDSIYVWHPGCGVHDSETWHSLTWSVPEVQAFWNKYPRVRFVPAREIEVAGSPAVVTAFESVTSPARIEVVTLRDSLQVVSVGGEPRADDAQ